MIKAFIRSTLEPEVMTDYLGGDETERGEERVGTYPGVEVVYYDDEIGDVEDETSHKGIAHYFLRPGSALETIDDVKERVQGEIARLTEVVELPEPEVQVPQILAETVDLEQFVGEELELNKEPDIKSTK